MKTFFEMLRLLEDEGLADKVPQDAAEQPQGPVEQPQEPASGREERKHYMFFSNLKAIKGMAEEMLAMDAAKIDEMLADGHDWAADHVATSKDDVEEVYNWLSGEMSDSGNPS
jgi:hypothetical protein